MKPVSNGFEWRIHRVRLVFLKNKIDFGRDGDGAILDGDEKKSFRKLLKLFLFFCR